MPKPPNPTDTILGPFRLGLHLPHSLPTWTWGLTGPILQKAKKQELAEVTLAEGSTGFELSSV